jgi:hypothetical protein
MDLTTMKAVVDQYKQARDSRLALQKETDALQEIEKGLANTILTALRDSESPVVGGTTHQCTRKITNEPTVEDWDALYGHIQETNGWDLLHRRVAAAAVKLRWDEGEEVPGVGAFPVEKLSLTKLPEGA